MSFFLLKVNNPSVRHPVWPVGHSIWPRWAPRRAPIWPRQAPCLALIVHPVWPPVGHPIWPLSGTPSSPVWHPVWPPLGTPSGRRRVKKKKKKNFFFFGRCCRLEKRGKNISVFNPQDPQVPRAQRASRAKPREDEGFFGLVPLVTHPSSIPLLGGLTPKFLSLSFHSL
jgi:hypothetical protein